MTNNQSIDVSAAADFTASFPGLKEILKQIKAESPIDPTRQPAQSAPPAQSNQSAQSPSPDKKPRPAATPASAAPDSKNTASPAEPPCAVALCGRAYSKAYERAREKGRSDYECRRDAARAYINEIPRLNKPENIHDFIDCVAYAMLIDVIPPADGTKILYAAQIALQATRANHAGNKIANCNKPPAKNPK